MLALTLSDQSKRIPGIDNIKRELRGHGSIARTQESFIQRLNSGGMIF
jgi:hypothetical protein